MTPADDMPTRATQAETMTLANMVPQSDILNRVLWRGLEASINEFAESEGELYIVTGPIYAQQPQRLHGRVAIPQAVFKAVYDPARSEAIAFVADNRDDARCRIISITALEQRIGFELFPGLGDEVDQTNAHVWPLPRVPRTPDPHCSMG